MTRSAARLAASLILALTAPGLAPYSAAASAAAPRVWAAGAVRLAPSVPAGGQLLPPSAALAAPALTAPAAPASVAAAPAALLPSAGAVPLTVSAVSPAPTPAAALSAAARAVALGAGTLGRVPSESAAAAGETQFRLLIGEKASVPSAVAAADGPVVPRASGLSPAASKPLDPVRRRGVRAMIAGTTVMKFGMETVTLSVPMLVLQGMGGAGLVAMLMVGYGVAQAAFSGAAGGLIDRSSPQKVLALAVGAQALLVGGIVALGAVGLLSIPLLAGGYVLVGGAAGIAETARQSIPARLLGQDAEELSRYNARLHIFYETSGVAGPLAAGALMAAFGPLWALLIQPPAYLAAAWLFSRLRLPEREGPAAAPAAGTARERIAEYFADIKAGARVVLRDPRLRWVGLAFVLPQILHRVLEGLLLPVYANRVLGHGGDAAYLLTASNLGELIGAVLLLRLAAKIPAPVWLKRAALALGLLWALVFAHSLLLALPIILMMSGTWSSSDLALRSEIQSSLSVQDLPRATSFLYGMFVLGGAAASLALGGLFDAVAPLAALAWACAAFTAVGAVVLYAARRLRRP